MILGLGWLRKKIVDSLRWRVVLTIVIVGILLTLGAAAGWLIATYTILR
jgi:hypothetical protein